MRRSSPSGWLRPLSPLHNPLARRLWLGYLLLATVTTVMFYVSDFGHFAYLHTRIDSTMLRFLANPLISLEMVWQSYPVIIWSVALLLFFVPFRHIPGVILERDGVPA